MSASVECPNCRTIFYANDTDTAEQILDAHLDDCREACEVDAEGDYE